MCKWPINIRKIFNNFCQNAEGNKNCPETYRWRAEDASVSLGVIRIRIFSWE